LLFVLRAIANIADTVDVEFDRFVGFRKLAFDTTSQCVDLVHGCFLIIH
jgi:hypothetical protein